MAVVFIAQSECDFVKILIIKYLRKYDSLSTISEDPSKASCVFNKLLIINNLVKYNSLQTLSAYFSTPFPVGVLVNY